MPVARSVSNFANNYRGTVSSRLTGPPDRSDTLLIRSDKYGDWTGKFGFSGNTSPWESLKDVPLRPSGISC
jgi:hypothetical protein